ncbi:LrgB family protein [Paenibacillus sp. GCM10023252]|uniref:LrgB family protein n=1 Tax=Paenibacillus sp. GCM10023252 TaxID=3252649 RepID=UPI003616F810
MNGMNHLYANPLFGVALTVGVYALAVRLHQKNRRMHPLLVTSIVLITALQLGGIPYEDYNQGGSILTFLLGPATVALAVPLYKQALIYRKQLLSILAGSTIGCSAGMAVNGWAVYATGGSKTLLLSSLPKSATSPVAIELARLLGGIPELGAVLAVLTGLLGSVIGPALVRRLGITKDAAIGAAVGTAAHGIGTARLLGESERQGGISGFAMAISAIVTSLLAVPVSWFL